MCRLSKLLIFIALSINGCGYRAEQGHREKRFGINGDAIYLLREDNKVVSVFKEEYHNEKFEILLSKDTLNVGDSLRSIILLASPNFRVVISKPSSQVIESDGQSTISSYNFVPEHPGVFDFAGTIEYDTMKAPFHYKFIVQ